MTALDPNESSTMSWGIAILSLVSLVRAFPHGDCFVQHQLGDTHTYVHARFAPKLRVRSQRGVVLISKLMFRLPASQLFL